MCYNGVALILRNFMNSLFLKLFLPPVQAISQLFTVNPLNAELNPIGHLLALAGAHHFVDVNRIRVNNHSVRQYSEKVW
jgi:hypothetical protein